ncbi:hypothetical protein HMPREF9225_0181 [Peptoniphilus duerdenii ATCC BAA-1640]|uniref:Lipoprotein n=1 Tax=Peptoniphilus duerdenii ATCC BAA-1640 TaxID=862517 RepID=E0NJ42_9FIRM|nr:hypothetical protein [Peptoniphilus duerdenii]EFM26161.1 hypothetical protein HMPREF9225_0181 [Peptoniphilus duerdenii ATCC BAA-1640]
MKKIKIFALVALMLLVAGCGKITGSAKPTEVKTEKATQTFDKAIKTPEKMGFKKEEVKVAEKDMDKILVIKYLEDKNVLATKDNEIFYLNLETGEKEKVDLGGADLLNKSQSYAVFANVKKPQDGFKILNVKDKTVTEVPLTEELKKFIKEKNLFIGRIMITDQNVALELPTKDGNGTYTSVYNIEKKEFSKPINGGFYQEIGGKSYTFAKEEGKYTLLDENGQTKITVEGLMILDSEPTGFIMAYAPGEDKTILYRITEDLKLEEIYSAVPKDKEDIYDYAIYAQDVTEDYMVPTIMNREIGEQFIYNRKEDCFIKIANEKKNMISDICKGENDELLLIKYEYSDGEGTTKDPYKSSKFVGAEIYSK